VAIKTCGRCYPTGHGAEINNHVSLSQVAVGWPRCAGPAIGGRGAVG
jgi:hypothetical protein